MRLTEEMINGYRDCMENEEKAPATVKKYMRDIELLCRFANGNDIDKTMLIRYKEWLCGRYSPAGVNSALSALNGFLRFCGAEEMKVKTVRRQRRIFADSEKELSKSEYIRLLAAAKEMKNERLYLIMQTILSTGIRVSELRHITVNAVGKAVAEISGKGKVRTVLIPFGLCAALSRYAERCGITNGSLFVTRSGRPVDNSNIRKEMKRAAAASGVNVDKVFPHNLRHLFARIYYSEYRDIVRLSDILGHSSIETTRIYTMESGKVHRRQIEALDLVAGI